MSLRPKQPKGKRKPIEDPRRNRTVDELIIDFTQRNAVSRKVLKEMKSFMKELPIKNHNEIPTLEFFTNGRERGYTMTVGNRAVHWAECRGSDDIVVYESMGTYNKYAYDNRVYFKKNETRKAAKYMMMHLF